jgi:hypothetical protein
MDIPQLPQGSRVLRLSLEKDWFDRMVSGEKANEFREPNDWMMRRLYSGWGTFSVRPKPYDYVLFYNGYGADKPWFLASLVTWKRAEQEDVYRRSYRGRYVDVTLGMVIISLGRVVQSGNLRPSA